MFGSDGATATSIRPHGLLGRPFTAPTSSSCQLFPPSDVRNRALPLGLSGPSPPERKVHPFRRKSHSPAKSTSGFLGSIDSPLQPVERFFPVRMSDQLFPPSEVL